MARRGYRYNLGGTQTQTPTNPQSTAQQDRDYQLRVASEAYRQSLAEQAARVQAAREAREYAVSMSKLQKEEATEQHVAAFHKFYGLIKDEDPNRRAQINFFLEKFPYAGRDPEVRKMLQEDNARIAAASKEGLTKEEAAFLAKNGPGTPAYEKTRKQVQDSKDPNHINAVLDFKRAWDLKRKAAGLPSDTAGMTMEQMDQYLTAKQQPQAPSAAIPQPSTPAPQNVAGWSNADLSHSVAPISGMSEAPAPTAAPATTPPAAKPSANPVQDFIKSSGLMKTSDNDRNELNNMLGETPETGFLSNKTPTPAPPPPQPKPTPVGATGPQYYTA